MGEHSVTPIRLALLLEHPEGPGCTACGRPWPAHPPEPVPPACCERCGSWFSYTAATWRPSRFLCRGCCS